VIEIADYVGRALTSGNGAFMSAQDADSEGEEGKCYVWSQTEFTALAGGTLAERFHVRPDGNFHDEASGDPMPVNIPHLDRATWRTIHHDAAWTEARLRLLAARDARVQPMTDDKVLADWNGLMIAALARAARSLADGTLLAMACSAYDGLADACGAGEALRHVGTVPAMLDDHAAIAWAAMELYQTTGQTRYAEDAAVHVRCIMERFVADDGTLCTVAASTHDVIVRQKQGYDSAYPCGNSIAAIAMTMLAAVNHDETLRAAAEQCVRSWGRALQTHSSGFCMLLCAWDVLVHGTHEIVLHGPADDPLLCEARALIGAAYLSGAVIMYEGVPSASKPIFDIASAPVPSVLWCHGSVCQRPMTSIEAVQDFLAASIARGSRG
jgi:hypothetical protein